MIIGKNTKEKEFIENELKTLVEKFPEIRARYLYEPYCDTHFVEITPKNFYYNEEYISWEINIHSKFTSNYRHENLCFITDDSVFRMKNCECDIKGGNYHEITI